MNGMKHMFTCAVAMVAGLALAGSAWATSGYMTGDAAMMKLIPYYETGENRATLIGIQNMSPREDSTNALHKAVADAEKMLMDNTNPDLDEIARLEKAIADAQAKLYKEHVFITVTAYDDMGMMMDGAVATLCLAEQQFGYVVLQGGADMGMDGHQGMRLSVMDGDIPEMGYVKVVAEDRKFTSCGVTGPNRLMNVDTDATDEDIDIRGAMSRVASWAIIQDVGIGFFGTEVQSATLSMAMTTATPDATPAVTVDGDPMLACYNEMNQIQQTLSTVDRTDGTGARGNKGKAPYTRGDFDPTRCGLIPERHDNTRGADGMLVTSSGAGGTDVIDATADAAAIATARMAADTATPRGYAYARYDAGDDTMVVVWLAEGMDTDDTRPSMRRMLDVTVICSDGTERMKMDADGNMMAIPVPAPTMLTTIDPNGMHLEEYTMMCPDDWGVLKIMMPDKSTAGMVFSHITQMGGHYRMNFPGYGMADPMTCYETGQALEFGADGETAATAAEQAAEAIRVCK